MSMPGPFLTEHAPARFFRLATGSWPSHALSVAADLGIADELATGPLPVDDIAEAVGAEPAALYRLLRYLVDVDVVRELEGRRFALTELGDLLRRDVPGSLRDWALYVGQPFYRNGWTGLLDSVRTGEPAFERQTGQAYFDYLRDHPDDAAMFDAAMTVLSTEVTAPFVLGAYDVGVLDTVVDVGGGQGRVLAAILAANPSVHGVLYDQADAVAGAEPVLKKAGVADRCELMAGDFFASVPAGGDCYLLSRVIHNWDDENAVRILANCRAAMRPNGRVLLVEAMVPDEVTPSPAKLLDLQMLVTTGGRERTEAEHADLLARAGLRLSRVVRGANPSLIEAVSP